MVDMTRALAIDGFIDLGEFYPEATTLEAANRIGAELGCRLWKQPESLTVNPTTAKPPNTYAGNYGVGELPLHTDLAHWHIPPRYLMLRCLIGDPAVATLVVHHREALRNISVGTLDRAMFRPRRRLDGQMFLLHLRQRGVFRWDRLFLVPANNEARQVQAALVDQPLPCRVAEIIFDKPGRTILIDNWTTLHGRSAAGKSPSIRRIERAYLSGEEHDE